MLRTLEGWSPSNSLDLKVLTIKTAALLAVATGRRCSSLSLLSTNEKFLQVSESRIVLQPVGLEKHTRPGYTSTPICLTAFNHNPGVC